MGIVTTLRKLSPPLYRLRILGFIVAVLILPFALYYLIIVRSQTAYFTDRSFRRLSLVSSQIASKVESAGLVLKNNSEKFINPKEPTESAKFVPGRSENIDDLEKIFKDLKDDSPEIIPISVDVVADGQQSPATVTLASVRHEEDAPRLYFSYVSDKRRAMVRAKADLNKLLQPLLDQRTQRGGSERDQFQNILISEAGTGRVIFQHDTTEVRLASLQNLTTADDTGKKIDVNDIGQTSSLVDVTLAGSNYKLFSHPLEISMPSGNGNVANTSWIVSGLIRSDYFRNEVWSISYTILIFCGFVTALLILSWPFLKLVMIGPKDRLGTADVYFLTFSIVVILAVFTCLGLYVFSYWKLERQLDSQLKALSTNVKKNLNQELTQALQQLDTLSKNCNVLKKIDGKACPQMAAQAPTNDIYQQGETEKTNILPEILRSPNTTYQYFDTAVWIDNTGMQRAKWTIKNGATQNIDVSGRAYFSNLRRGDFYQLNESRVDSDGKSHDVLHKFWLEPIISKTTGRNEVEISKLAVDPRWVSAFDTRLISLMQPALPAGFGYVIIGTDGKVLFHSDEAHHLGENFFQECDNDPDLRSAVIGRSDVPLNVRYVGEGHRVLVTPVNGFPQWSLIVFQNKQPLRSAFLELLSLVSLLFLIYALIILTCFTVFYLLNVNNERRAWLWPSPRKRALYYQSFLQLLGLSIISGLICLFLHGQMLVWIIAGIGLLSALVFFLNLRFGTAKLWPRQWRIYLPTNRLGKYDVAYVLSLTFLLLLIAILPAAAFFKYAYESEMKVFIKHGQFTITAELAKRDQRIRAQYSNIKTVDSDLGSGQPETAEPGMSLFTQRRLALDWDVYEGFFFNTNRGIPSASPCPNDSSSELLTSLNTLLPLYNQTSVERRGLLSISTANGVCKWEPGPDGNLVLHLNDNIVSKTAWPWRHLNTVVPRLERPKEWLIAFALAYIPFFLLVHFIVRKVFLLDVYKPSSRPLKAFLSEKIDRNLFIVVDAPFVEKTPLDKSNLYLTDLRHIANLPGWADKFDESLPGEGKVNEVDESLSDASRVIALDNFDYRIDDPQTNQQKLTLVERLLEKNRKLMIFSAVEPSKYSFQNGNAGLETNSLDEAGRWVGVMSQFFTEHAEDTGDRQDFEKQVEQEKERILATDLRGQSRDRIEKLIDTLRSECGAKGPLQHVGLQILTHESFVTLSCEHLLNRIVNQARPYYNHLWNTCSDPEKLTLFHLAQDRLLSHRDPDIGRLLRRELIVRDNDLHLMNDSFRQFVKSTEIEFVAEQEQKAREGSLWHTLKVPMLVVLVAITIFLFVTQRDLYTSSLAIVTAVTTIIPAFFKLLTVFHSDPARPQSQG